MNHWGRAETLLLPCPQLVLENRQVESLEFGPGFHLLAQKRELWLWSCERRSRSSLMPWSSLRGALVPGRGWQQWALQGVAAVAAASGGAGAMSCCAAAVPLGTRVLPEYAAVTVSSDRFWKLHLPLLYLVTTRIKACEMFLSFLFIFEKRNICFKKKKYKEANTNMLSLFHGEKKCNQQNKKLLEPLL